MIQRYTEAEMAVLDENPSAQWSADDHGKLI